MQPPKTERTAFEPACAESVVDGLLWAVAMELQSAKQGHDGLVHDILMQLTPMELEQLYSEPSVRAYRPEAVPCEVSTRLALVHVFLLYGAISLSRRSLMKPIRNTPRSCVILRYGWACPPRLCCWYSMKLGFDSSVFRGVGGLWLWTCSRLSGLRPESCRKDCLTRRKSIRLCVPSHIA